MSASDRVQSDIKKLKSKYNFQLSTLKELFSDWTEEDLLFTLQDADGDLEIAIDRIAEGHANQWDEVKTKKSKKEAAANKPTAEAPAINNTSTATTTTATTIATPKANNVAIASKYDKKQQRPFSHPRPVQKSTTTSSWQQKSDRNNDSWNTITPKKISSTTGPKTWASLLQHSKPEPEHSVKKDLPLKKVDESWSKPTVNNDIPIDLSSLSINEEKKLPKESDHISMADLLNSVKQTSLPQEQEPTVTTPSFINMDYGMYGFDPFFHQQQQRPAYNNTSMFQQQQQQQQQYNSFYFNGYLPYGQSPFTNNMYPQQPQNTQSMYSNMYIAQVQRPTTTSIYNGDFSDFFSPTSDETKKYAYFG